MPIFSKTATGVYKVIIITGHHDSFLGISFAENDKESPEIIELQITNELPITNRNTNRNTNTKKQKILPSKEEVLKNVLEGLESINKDLQTSYKLSKIYYVACSDGPTSHYQHLVRMLVRRYHDGDEFEES